MNSNPIILPYATPFAAVVPRFTGGLSAISSCLIIYLILISEKRLSTIYHRIMFFMSWADIFSSVAMALTTLPMPKTMPDSVWFAVPYNDWSGMKLGNTQTCEVQGFFFTFGIVAMYSYNAMLCIYYACAIALKMKERNICRFVEPALHLFPFAVGIAAAVPPLFYNLYNPPAWESWCFMEPLGCGRDGGIVSEICVSGELRAYELAVVLCSAVLGFFFFVIITALIMICASVVKVSRQYLVIVKDQENMPISVKDSMQQSIMERIRKNHEVTKTVLVQALVYFLAFLLTLAFPLIQLAGFHKEGAHWPMYLQLIFTPMQGFFNFLIFLYYKVANYRRMHLETSTKEILRLFFLGKAIEPLEISRISLLKFDEEQRMLEVDIYSEEDEEYLSYAFSNEMPASVATKDRVDFRFLASEFSQNGCAPDAGKLDGPPSRSDRDTEDDCFPSRVVEKDGLNRSSLLQPGCENASVPEINSSGHSIAGEKRVFYDIIDLSWVPENAKISSNRDGVSSKGDLSGFDELKSISSPQLEDIELGECKIAHEGNSNQLSNVDSTQKGTPFSTPSGPLRNKICFPYRGMEKGKRRFFGRIEFSSVASSQDKKLPYIHDEVSSK
mmetsp:Transcript_2935/g.4165  ORF Transcript_2935/g.4165 Transcript_2935/m.4165 type:complete len:613 (-) Transcript_2935:841-2679(-)